MAKTKPLKNMTLTELKAQAFDMQQDLAYLQAGYREVLAEIQKRINEKDKN